MQSSQTMDQLAIDGTSLKRAARLYRAINNRLRLQLLFVIHRHSRMCVTDIYKFLRIKQVVASQHLSILRESGLVKTQREGIKVFYSINYELLNEFQVNTNRLLGEAPSGSVEQKRMQVAYGKMFA